MRAFAACLLVAVVWACGPSAPAPGAETPCETVFPGLRVDTACGSSLRVVLDGRDIPPTPRRLDLDGAVILPWPDWAMEGMPSVAEAGGASVQFTAHPYMCQEVALACGVDAASSGEKKPATGNWQPATGNAEPEKTTGNR